MVKENLAGQNTESTGTVQAGQDPAPGKRVALNSLSGMVANGLYLASRLVITPYILVYISLEQYGLWSLCFVVISYAGLSGFGINNAYIKYVAEYRAKNDLLSINRLINTGIATMVLFSVTIFTGLCFGLPLLLTWFSVDPELAELSTWLIIGSTAAFLIDLSLGAFKALLEGLQEIALVRLIWLGSCLIEVGLIFLFLGLGMGVQGLLYALIVRYLLGVVAFCFCAHRRLRGFRLSLAHLDRSALTLLFQYGSKVQTLGFIGIFMTTFDRIMATTMIGLEATGLFEVARKFPVMGASVSSAAYDSFLPAASSMGGFWTGPDTPPAREKVKKYLALCASATALGGLFLIVLVMVMAPEELASVMANSTGVAGIAAALLLSAGIGLTLYLKRLMATSEHFHGENVAELYLRGSRYTNLVNSVIFSFLLVTAQPLIRAWVGDGFEASAQLMIILTVSVWVNQFTGPGTAIVRGTNRVGRELEYALVNLVLAVLWIPGMTMIWGLPGAALGTALSTAVASLYFVIRTNRAFDVGLSSYFSGSMLPSLAPVLSATAVWGLLGAVRMTDRWTTVLIVAAFGVLHLLLTALLLRCGLLTSAEWDIVKVTLNKIRGKINPARSSIDKHG
jgi:O-antigen/teichoic acid export membrane protein